MTADAVLADRLPTRCHKTVTRNDSPTPRDTRMLPPHRPHPQGRRLAVLPRVCLGMRAVLQKLDTEIRECCRHAAECNRIMPMRAVIRLRRLEQDDFSSNRHPALTLCLSMSFFAKPVPTFCGTCSSGNTGTSRSCPCNLWRVPWKTHRHFSAIRVSGSWKCC